MALSKKDRKKLRLEKLRKQSAQAQSDFQQREQVQQAAEKSNATRNKVILFSSTGVGLALVLAAVVFSVSYFTGPGPFDGFAHCLTENNVQLYGASWCEFTDGQMDMFGKSIKHVDYRDYKDFPEEELGDISVTPTWVINGKVIENVQPLDYLAKESGCALYS